MVQTETHCLHPVRLELQADSSLLANILVCWNHLKTPFSVHFCFRSNKFSWFSFTGCRGGEGGNWSKPQTSLIIASQESKKEELSEELAREAAGCFICSETDRCSTSTVTSRWRREECLEKSG